jgi:hypothetical protein
MSRDRAARCSLDMQGLERGRYETSCSDGACASPPRRHYFASCALCLLGKRALGCLRVTLSEPSRMKRQSTRVLLLPT